MWTLAHELTMVSVSPAVRGIMCLYTNTWKSHFHQKELRLGWGGVVLLCTVNSISNRIIRIRILIFIIHTKYTLVARGPLKSPIVSDFVHCLNSTKRAPHYPIAKTFSLEIIHYYMGLQQYGCINHSCNKWNRFFPLTKIHQVVHRRLNEINHSKRKYRENAFENTCNFH